MKKQSLRLLATVFILLGVLTPFVLWNNFSGNVMALPLTPPTTPPVTPPTVTPTPNNGSYSISLFPNQTDINCYLGDTNCYLQVGYHAYNSISQPLYNTTLYTSNFQNVISYVGFDGNWTTGTSRTSRVIQPGEEAVSTVVKVTPPSSIGTFYVTLYVDGQTCKTNLTPPDCYYYGATATNFKITVLPKPTPTVVIPTPTPTSTPTPTPTPTVVIPTPTPTPVVIKNRQPVVMTSTLKTAKAGVKYQDNILVKDPDGDRIQVIINNLPWGVRYSCVQKAGITNCNISGVPVMAGFYNVRVTAKDNWGQIAVRYLRLTVLPKR